MRLVNRSGNPLYNFEIVDVGQLTISRTTGDTMEGTKSIPKQLDTSTHDAVVLANAYKISGTPYRQPMSVIGRVDGNTLTLNAYGTSFTSGQVLDIRYVVLFLKK